VDDAIAIFVSHTSDYRRAVRYLQRRLPAFYRAYTYLDAGAQGRPIDQILREEIEGSDVFVGIVGHRHGSPYDDARSAVEWEFDTASRVQHLDVMVFIKDVRESKVEPKQREFRRRLAPGVGLSGRWVKFFTSKRSLVYEVRTSLEWWLFRNRAQRRDRSQGVPTGLESSVGAPTEYDSTDRPLASRLGPLVPLALAALISAAALWLDGPEPLRWVALALASLSVGVAGWVAAMSARAKDMR
jgi:hypothetical protein